MNTPMNMPGWPVRALIVLWPAFAAAGLIEGLVFTLVDPLELHGFGGAVLSRPAVHTLAFLLFWLLTSAASAATLLLCERRDRAGSP